MSRKRVDHDASKTLAALLGAPLTACLVGAALTRWLPLSEGAAFAWGVHLIFPVWVGLGVLLPLARTGLRAWAICLCVALPAAGALWLGQHAPPSTATVTEARP